MKIKYIQLFFLTITILIIAQFLSTCIPNSLIEKNMIESLKNYNEKDNYEPLIKTEKEYLNDSFLIDNYGDSLILNIIWNSNNNKNPLISQIKQEYYKEPEEIMSKNLSSTILNNKNPNENYSRYWIGTTTYIKPLLIFFKTNTIKLIISSIIIILSIYLIILILKKSKTIGIIFILSYLSINPLTMIWCFEYQPILLVLLLSSIFAILNINNDKLFYYNMIVTGTCSCFFDLLTIETITITIPLLLKITLSKNKSIKETLILILKSSLLWLMSYSLTFLIKWTLSILVYGMNNITDIWDKAKIRIYKMPHDQKKYLGIILYIPSLLLPFSLFEEAPFIFIIYLLIYLYILIFKVKRKNKHLILLLISGIGILRLVVLNSHSYYHYFFDYRALMPFIFVTLYTIFKTLFDNFTHRKL